MAAHNYPSTSHLLCLPASHLMYLCSSTWDCRKRLLYLLNYNTLIIKTLGREGRRKKRNHYLCWAMKAMGNIKHVPQCSLLSLCQSVSFSLSPSLPHLPHLSKQSRGRRKEVICLYIVIRYLFSYKLFAILYIHFVSLFS